MTTTWKIYNLEHQKSDGLVVKVTYGVVIEGDNILDRIVKQVNLTGDSTSENFIPYAELTEQQVIDWVKAELGAEEVTSIETTLQDRAQAAIDAQAAKTTEEGLPW